MAPAQPPESINLKIKVPPGHLTLPAIPDGGSATAEQGSFDLGSLPVSTTVGALRQQIQTSIPTNPAPERQRLLYGGRALIDNEQTLADAFNTKRDVSQTVYVVHLLVKGDGANAGPHGAPASLSSGVGTAGTPQTAPQPGQGPPLAAELREAAERLRQQTAAFQAAHMPPQHAQANQQQGAMPPFTAPHMPGQPPMMGGGMRMPMGMNFSHGMQMPPQMPWPPQQQQPATGQAPGHTDEQNTSAQTPQGTQPQTTGLDPQQAQQQGQRRPVSGQGFHMQGVGPNGQRFEFHQQTINIPHMVAGQPGQQMPFGLPMPHMQPGIPQGFPGPPAMPLPRQAQVPPPRQPNGPSALDRARENMTEMRRMLAEMRDQTDVPSEEERRTRLDAMEQRVIGVNNYIDPLNAIPTNTPTPTTGNDTTGRRSAPPNARPEAYQRLAQRLNGWQAQQQQQQPRQLSTRNPTEVTAYLLSGPQGPHALLFSPQHGTFQGALQPTPTRTTGIRPVQATANQQIQQGQQPVPGPQEAGQVAAPGAVAQQGAAGEANPAAAQDPLGPLQPILAHVWMLLRILIFAYFILGTNMGYTRPMILAGVGMVFWAIRMGALGDGAAVRRWWDGVVGAPQRPVAQVAQGQDGENRDHAQNDGAPAQAGQDGVQNRQPMPTPEQVAQRLLNEQAERNQDRRGWLREQIRPVERAAALFVASLWPGIGEAHVREQRRLREEADAERLREEGERERVRREEEEEKKAADDEVAKAAEAEAGKTDAVAAGGDGEASGGQDAGAATATASSSAEKVEGRGSGA